MATPVVVGTRGSALALAQTALVIGWLRATTPDLCIKTKTIATAGDKKIRTPISDGLFVKEIQQSLLKGGIDLSVHSLKDQSSMFARNSWSLHKPRRAAHTRARRSIGMHGSTGKLIRT